MMRPSRLPTILTVLAAFAVLITLLGCEWPSLWLVYIFKPLATLLIIAIAFQNWAHSKSAYSQWILMGLCFSLIGDVLLIWPNQYFLAGLAAFLLAHVAYLIAFTRDCTFPASLPVWMVYLAVAAAFFVVLFPTLPAGLRVPVAAYAALLSTMAGQAMGRFLLRHSRSAQCAAMGALLFLISDLLLALHRFHRPLLHSTVLILVPYYFGQWFIACSTAAQPPTSQSR
jgi:uncharacterized membrane protein YhhN